MPNSRVPCASLELIRGRECGAWPGSFAPAHFVPMGVPIKLSDTPGTVRTAPPTLGQHTNEILGELGLNSKAIAELRQKGVV